MATGLTEILRRPESEEFDRKSALDPTNTQDYLELVVHLVAMANTRGGSVLIGTQGSAISKADLPLFDSARIDDKVNSLVEPRVGGIKSSLLGSDFMLIEIERSRNPPHVFKQDGNCTNRQQKPTTVFRRGDAYVRHSSKSERANRTDFERWLESRQQRLFENVKLVFQASPEAQIQIADGPGGMPVRIDPSAPGAQPVYDLLTADPFRDLEQELTGALKAWKTSHQLLNEAQIYKAYAERDMIRNPEVTELLLKSSWERHMQGYLWASRLDAATLVRLIREVVTADGYPAPQEALKISAMLPREHARAIFQLVEGTYRKNIKKVVRRLEPVLRARARKFEVFVEALCPGQRLTYKAGEGVKEVKTEAVTESTFDEILHFLLEGNKENRGVFKFAELLVFGRLVTNVDFSALTMPEVAPAELGPPEGEKSADPSVSD
jgi:hypothetical protein